MKFRLDRQRFLEAVQLVGGVVAPRAIKPIYESLQIVSRDGGIEILATDLEVGIRLFLDDVAVEEAGTMTIPAQRLSSILREVVDDSIEIGWRGQTCEIVAQGSRFKVLCENPDDFPEIPEFDERGMFAVPNGTFTKLVAKTGFAAAKEKARFALNGIQMTVAGTEIACVATDGRRLAMMNGACENPDGVERSGIIPTKGMSQMVKVLTEGDEVIRLNLGESLCLAQTRRAVISSRLVEGQYPPVKEVIPANTTNRVVLNRAEIIAALRKARILTNQESRVVRLGFESGGRLLIDAQAVEVGEAHIEMAVEYTGEPMRIGFNPEFLLEGFGAAEGETARFELSAPNSPGKIMDDAGYTYVVSPVSLE